MNNSHKTNLRPTRALPPSCYSPTVFFSFFPNVQPVDYSVAFLHLFVIFSQFPFGRAGSLSHTAHCAAEVRCPGKGYRPQFTGYITFRLFCRFQCDAAHPTVVGCAGQIPLAPKRHSCARAMCCRQGVVPFCN